MAETTSIDFSGTMIEKNLHTHTFRCKHADGDVQDYAKAALQAGLKMLGMSDHTPLPDGRWSTVRMGMEELDAYANAIRNARQAFPGLKILSGMECEWMPEYRSFFEEDLLGRLALDYLIGSVHYFPFKGEWRNVIDGVRTSEELFSYTEWVIRTMETGLFSFIAHPDLFANSCVFRLILPGNPEITCHFLHHAEPVKRYYFRWQDWRKPRLQGRGLFCLVPGAA